MALWPVARLVTLPPPVKRAIAAVLAVPPRRQYPPRALILPHPRLCQAMPDDDLPPLPPAPKLLPWLLAIGILANLLPIWTVTWLPMGDLFGHVQLMDIVLRYSDPATTYKAAYLLPRSLDPNTLSLWFARAVPGMGALTAARALLSAYVIGLPLSLAWLARTWRRSPFLALLSLPLTWNALVNIGFLNYIIALPVLFCVLALARRYAESGRWQRGVGLALLLMLLFFCHVIAFLIGMGMAVFVLLWHGEGWQRLTRLWVVLAAAPVGGQWVWRKFVALEATAEGRTFGTHSGDLGLWFLKRKELVDQLYEWSLQYFRDGVDRKMAWAALLLWLALLLIGLFARLRGTVKGQLQWRDRSLELMTVLCAIAYFHLPSHMNEMAIITERVVMQVILMATLWPQLEFTAWRRWLLVPMMVLAVGYAWTVRQEFRRFERVEIGGLPEAMRDLPAKSRFCYVLNERDNQTTYMGAVWHVPRAIFALQHGGLVDDSFAVRPYTPVQYRPGAMPTPLIGAFWDNPHLFDYDTVLVREAALPVYAEMSPYLKRIWHQGHFWLYHVVPGDRAHVHVASAGGDGGTGEFSDCARGLALNGLIVQQKDDIVRSLTPLCGELKGRAGQAAAPPAPDGRPRPAQVAKPAAEDDDAKKTGRRLGTRAADAEDVRLRCPADTFVVGITGRAGLFVDALGILCAPIPWIGDERRLASSRVVGGPGGTPFTETCKLGEVAVGAQGAFGEVADQAGIACVEWSKW